MKSYSFLTEQDKLDIVATYKLVSSFSKTSDATGASYGAVRTVLVDAGMVRSRGESLRTYYEQHPEDRKQISDKMVKFYNETPEARERVRQQIKGTDRKAIGEKISKAKLDSHFHHSVESRKKMSESHKGVKYSPERIAKMVKASRQACAAKPNMEELELGQLISQVSSDFRYNGNCELGVTIGGKVPDYINANGKKQVINFNGCYWHSCPKCYPNHGIDENELRNDITPYTDLGFKCLVIWGHELLDREATVDRIREFIHG